MPSISRFLAELVACCPGVSSVWLIGERAGAAAPHVPGPAIWDLVAFGGATDLQRVRMATQLHRIDVRLRVVVDGDRFGTAWGEPSGAGSLSQWEWKLAGAREAFYFEARWREPVQAGLVERLRRKAVCLWQASAS